MSRKLNHFDAAGKAHMVDVGDKPSTRRTAVAVGFVKLLSETAELIEAGTAKKGDVLGTARLAGIMACKQTPTLIPLCHVIPIDSVNIEFSMGQSEGEHCQLEIKCSVRSTGNTGVEMEALTGVSIAALTVYDMCKSVDREMEILGVKLVSKTGGASGEFQRTTENKDGS